jgi:hypothetical protein
MRAARPKFCRHAGLDPASSFIIILKLFWIPASAGMTLRMNQRQEYQCVKRTYEKTSALYFTIKASSNRFTHTGVADVCRHFLFN